jgi:hypothetical protein
VGNSDPGGVKLVCVDINPAVVTKLADRGSIESTAVTGRHCALEHHSVSGHNGLTGTQIAFNLLPWPDLLDEENDGHN